MFSPGSHKKVFWKCSKNPSHDWEAAILNRTNGAGCPYCSGKLASKDNNLAVKYPELSKEWHRVKNGKLTPDKVTPGSDRKVWWICERGHEWHASIGSRTRGSGCPYCESAHSGRRASKTHNLAVKYPQIAKEWHPTRNGDLTPFDVTPGSSTRKVWWKCSEGHEWMETPNHRTGMNTGCPFCSGHRASEEYNLAAKYPQIAKEWHPTKNGDLTPSDVTPYSGKRVWWMCDEGHEWEAFIQNRTRRETKCPICHRIHRKEKKGH
jgi:hypothetical protein